VKPVSVERVIAAPADEIFAVLADPARHQEIDGSGTVRQPTKAPARLSLGARFGMGMRIGAPYKMVSVVTEFEEGRRIAWRPVPDYPVVNRLVGGRTWRYELEPVEGGTLVRETWDPTTERIPVVVRAAAGVTRSNMEKTLAKLEEVVTG
jgi:uncharacterized protein YndB with AHSA1/START domain